MPGLLVTAGADDTVKFWDILVLFKPNICELSVDVMPFFFQDNKPVFLLSKDVHMVMSLSVAVCHYYCLLCNTLCKGIFRKEFVFLVTIYFSLEYRREREGILLHYSTLD